MSKCLKLSDLTAAAGGACGLRFARAQMNQMLKKNRNIGTPFKLESRSRGGHRRGHPSLLPLQVR
jgi:hypothetical protein